MIAAPAEGPTIMPSAWVTWGRCRGDVGEMRGRCGGDVGEIEGRHRGDTWEICGSGRWRTSCSKMGW